jgi:uncharacterized protein
MIEDLRSIQNPLLRSVATAGVAFTIATILAGAATGLIKDKAKYGVYASLLSTGCGAIAGLVLRKPTAQSPITTVQDPDISSSAIADVTTWNDWRAFVVTRKVKESEEITSFYLQPQDQGRIPSFLPGQFLTIRLDIPGQAKPVIRTYSLSDDSESCETYRLSIKREPAPNGLAVPPGLASNFMHDQIHEGSVIQAKPPSGRFVLDTQRSTPIVLISNGVGITPMISMAKACSRANPNREVWFLHGARDGNHHAFRDEVQAIAHQTPNLRVHYTYSRPTPDDEGHYHSVGYVDTALVRSLVEKDAEFFLCGSPPFLQSLIEGLRDWGVPSERVFFESFGQPMKVPSDPASVTSGKSAVRAEITFARSGKTITWNEGDGSILEVAEAHGLNPDYSCRQGICGTCMCQIRQGEVDYEQEPIADIEPGSVLICISKPRTAKVELEI